MSTTSILAPGENVKYMERRGGNASLIKCPPFHAKGIFFPLPPPWFLFQFFWLEIGTEDREECQEYRKYYAMISSQ